MRRIWTVLTSRGGQRETAECCVVAGHGGIVVTAVRDSVGLLSAPPLVVTPGSPDTSTDRSQPPFPPHCNYRPSVERPAASTPVTDRYSRAVANRLFSLIVHRWFRSSVYFSFPSTEGQVFTARMRRQRRMGWSKEGGAVESGRTRDCAAQPAVVGLAPGYNKSGRGGCYMAPLGLSGASADETEHACSKVHGRGLRCRLGACSPPGMFTTTSQRACASLPEKNVPPVPFGGISPRCSSL